MNQLSLIVEMPHAAPEAVGLDQRGLERVTRLVRRYVEGDKLAGAVTAVSRRGRLAYVDVQGDQDAEAGIPMREDSLFRLYSMTKPIASVALMTLYEEGRFQLDDPVAAYVPEFEHLAVFVEGSVDEYRTRPPARPMTVRDVLTHTSGLSAGGRSVPGRLFQGARLQELRGDGALKDSWTPHDLINAISKIPLESDPAASWRYGISTDVVAHLCEVISGTSFDRFLRSRVFEPLGMRDTAYAVERENAGRLTACYAYDPDSTPRYRLADAVPDSRMTQPKTYFSGAGGLVSSVSDYLRFCQMLLNGGTLGDARVLGSRTVRFMTSNHLPGGVSLSSLAGGTISETSYEGVGFGLGFAVLLDPVAAQTVGSAGEYYWGGAASTSFFVSPEDELAVVFLTQLRPSSAYPIRRELRAAVYSAICD